MLQGQIYQTLIHCTSSPTWTSTRTCRRCNEKCIDIDIQHIDIYIVIVETNDGCCKEAKEANDEAILRMDPKRAVHDSHSFQYL